MKTASELIDELYEAKSFGHTDKALEDRIFEFMAQDKTIIPALLAVLAHERANNKAYVSELNEAVSISLATLEGFPNDKDMNENAKLRIKLFYKKWEHRIACCFKIPGLI